MHEVSADDIRLIREWMEKLPHIPKHWDDKVIAGFIRGSKGSVQRAKLVIEGFCAAGYKMPVIFNPMDTFHKPLQRYLDVGRDFIFPKKTEDGCNVMFLGITREKHDPYDYPNTEHHKYFLMTLMARMWNNEYGSGKMIYLIDGTGITLTHFRATTPTLLREWFDLILTGLPIQVKGMHIYNIPFYAEWLITIAKEAMKKKLRERVFTHTDPSSLHQYFAKSMLPKEYGGDGESIDVLHDQWRTKMESLNDIVVEEYNKIRALDKFRPKEEKNSDTIGTFRKLNVD